MSEALWSARTCRIRRGFLGGLGESKTRESREQGSWTVANMSDERCSWCRSLCDKSCRSVWIRWCWWDVGDNLTDGLFNGGSHWIGRTGVWRHLRREGVTVCVSVAEMKSGRMDDDESGDGIDCLFWMSSGAAGWACQAILYILNIPKNNSYT